MIKEEDKVKIVAVETAAVLVPSKGDYRMARGVHDALRSVVVRVRTDEGVVGAGESHQGVAGYTPETVETMRAVIDHIYGPLLVGRELEAVEALARDMALARQGNRFARCAVEMALWDAMGKACGRSVCALLGGPVRGRLALSASIGIDDADVMARKAAEYVSGGFRTVKVKVGTPDVSMDLVRVREIRRAVGAGVAIRIDANEGYAPDVAQAFIRGLDGLDIEHVEQPVAGPHLDAMARLAGMGIVPILADESVHSPEDAHRLIAMRAADAIKIKLTKVGGYIAARKIIDLAEAAGLKLVIGQGICSSIEAAAEAQLACAYPHIHEVAEMVGPTKLRGDLADPGLDLEGGFLALPEAPGIGLSPSQALLDKYHYPAPH